MIIGFACYTDVHVCTAISTFSFQLLLFNLLVVTIVYLTDLDGTGCPPADILRPIPNEWTFSAKLSRVFGYPRSY